MKIYEIGTGYTPIPAKMGAATEIVVEELTKSMLKSGADVSIVDIKAYNRLPNNLPIIEVPVPGTFTGTDVSLGVMHKVKRVVYSINLASTLKKLIKSSQDKIVLHFHNQYNMYFFLKLTSNKTRSNCHLIYTNHSYIWHNTWAEIEETIKKRYFQEVYCMKNAVKVFVLNDIARHTIIEKLEVDSSKVVLIDNGVNTDVYRPLPKSNILEFKEKRGLNGKKVFLQVGSVCDRKNQMGALKLLLPFLKKDRNNVFLYAGGIIDQEYQDSILGFAKKNGCSEQVLYVGEISPGEELNRYYNSAEVMVFPSKSEGFSLVIIEAMSASIPVIVNRNLQFKLSDMCLNYETPEEFCDLIGSHILNSEEHDKLSRKVRNAVLKNYSWDKIANDYMELCGRDCPKTRYKLT